jgi:hypothetical protein
MIRMAYEFLKYVKDNRGVEGLPLKYMIIILVAAVVIAIAIAMTTSLRDPILKALGLLGNKTVESVNNSLNFT